MKHLYDVTMISGPKFVLSVKYNLLLRTKMHLSGVHVYPIYSSVRHNYCLFVNMCTIIKLNGTFAKCVARESYLTVAE